MVSKYIVGVIDIDEENINRVYISNELADKLGVVKGGGVIFSYKGEQFGSIVEIDDMKNADNSRFFFPLNMIKKYGLIDGNSIDVHTYLPLESVNAIGRKLKGGHLTENEITSIISDFMNQKLNEVEKTFFVSTFFNSTFSDDEIVYFIKGMVSTGKRYKFTSKFPIVDKHSIGGVAGKGITPILVSICACLDMSLPNTSSRSLTTPAGTSDILESVMSIFHSGDKLQKFLDDENGFLAWIGGIGIVPLDDEIMHIVSQIGVEDDSEYIVSILSKKVALGIDTLLIDIPCGESLKVKNIDDARKISDRFVRIGELLGIKVHTYIREPKGIDGNGIGAKLEIREALYVLEQSDKRSMQLEEESLNVAAQLINTVKGIENGYSLAKDTLTSLNALQKFRRICKMQGGSESISSSDISIESKYIDIHSGASGSIVGIDNKKAIQIALSLGCPHDKDAGIYFYKNVGDSINKGDVAFSIYSTSEDKLNSVNDFIKDENILLIK